MSSGHQEPTENHPRHGSKTEDVIESSSKHDDAISRSSQESDEFKSHHNSNEDNEIKSQSSSDEDDIIKPQSSSDEDNEIKSQSKSDEDRETESTQNNNEECDNNSKPNSKKNDEIKFSQNSHNNSKIKSSKSFDSDTDTEKENSNTGDDIKASRISSSVRSRPTRPTTPEKGHKKATSPATSPDAHNNTSGSNPDHERMTPREGAAPTPAHTNRSGTNLQRPDWQMMQIGFDFHNWPVAIFRGSGAWRRPDRDDERRQVARLSKPKRPISPDPRFDGWRNIFSRYWDIQLWQDRRDGRSHTAGKGNRFQRGHGDKRSENQDNSDGRQGRRRGRSHKKDSRDGRLLGRPQTTPPTWVRPNGRESGASKSEHRPTSLKPSEKRRGQGQTLPPIDQDQRQGGGEKIIPGLKRSYSGLRTPSREEMDQMVKRHTRITSAFQAKTSPNPN